MNNFRSVQHLQRSLRLSYWLGAFALCGGNLVSADEIESVVVASGFHDPMEIAVLPNDDLIVVEREGRILRVRPATGGVFEIGHLDVTALRATEPNAPWAREDGLLGIAIDPAFSENQRIYLYYSAPDKLLNRLSRFTLKEGKLDRSSERMLLEIPTDRRDRVCHHAGSLAFGPDGLLFLSVGDNTSPFESAGSSPIDDREGRGYADAQRSAGNTNDLRGKILCIRPTESGYEIPEGNLFPPGTAKTRPEIYAMGCRNPFRISIDPKTRAVYWGEVGPDADNGDSRGPRGYDEVNQALSAGNFGWPFVIADNQPYPIFDFAAGKAGAMTKPDAPINPGQRNTGLRELPPAHKALIWYPYVDSPEFPSMGSGGRNAMAGPVFYYDSGRKWNLLAESDDHTLLTYDWMRGRMWKAKLGEGEKLESLTPFLDKLKHPMDLETSKDGTMWLLEYGSEWYFNKDGQIRRLRPTDGNHAPTLKIAEAPGSARTYEAKDITDADGDAVKVEWWLTQGADEKSLGGESKITVPEGAGSVLRAVATDAKGAVTVARVALVKENTDPELLLIFKGNPGAVTTGQTLNYQVKSQGDLDGNKVVVRARYIPPTGHDAGGPELPTKVTELATARQCFACHQVDRNSVGPRYLDVSLKYRGHTNAVETLKNKIKTGGAGVWGEIPMPPQVAVTPEEAGQLVNAILGLAEGITEARGSAEGNLALPVLPEQAAPGGAWEFSAEAPGFTAAKFRIADQIK